MKIKAQDTSGNNKSYGFDITGGPQFKDVLEGGGDVEVKVDDKRDLYDLVDNFGKRKFR